MHEPVAATPVEVAHTSPGSGIKLPLQVLAGFASVVMLQYAAPVLLPIVLALFLFYALDPIVDRLHKWRVPRLLASFVVVALLTSGIIVGVYGLWPQISAVVQQVPEGAAKLRTTFQQQKTEASNSIINKVQEAANAIDSAAAEVATPAPNAPGVVKVEVQQPLHVSDWLWSGGVGMLSFAAQAITVLFLTIFLLNEDDSFKRKLVSHMETLGSKRVTVNILNDIAKQIERFIWLQAFTSAVVAAVTALALGWLGLKQPIVWGLFAGIMNIIPYFGPLIVSAVLAMIAFLQFGTMVDAFTVAAVAMAITTFEGMFLTPHLISRASSLNHVAIFVAIAFWSWAWGVSGMLLAVPMLMVLKAICDHVDGLQNIGEFLGE
jgi:predicted PurR-regulated permease PerM